MAQPTRLPVGMQTDLSRRRRAHAQVFSSVYVVGAALVTIAYAVFSARASQSWIMGEWLIDYAGGFVRRGLPGEAVLRLAHEVHTSPVSVALTLQLLLYGCFYVCTWLLARRVLRWSLPLIALFVSPATLTFVVLDPPSSVRKEIVLLLAVALATLYSGRLLRRPLLLASLLSAASAVCVLSHEGLVFYLPYLVAPVLLAELSPARGGVPLATSGSLHRAAWICLPALAGLACAGAAATHPGNRAIADAICRSLGATPTDDGRGICGGAIAYLAHDRAFARADLLRAAHAYHYGTLYGLTGVLAALPAAALLVRMLRSDRRRGVVLLAVVTLSGASSLVLFAVARDWGRWISIHVTCLLLLFLSLAHSESPTEARRDGIEPMWEVPRSAGRRVGSLLTLVVYATCWNLPATGNYHARFGYAGLVHYLSSYRSAPHSASSLP